MDQGTTTPVLKGSIKYDASLHYRRVGNTVIFDVKMTRDEYENWIKKLPNSKRSKP